MDCINKMFVVGLGEVLWDMLPEGKQLGGAPANFAYQVSQCAFPTMLISAVGDDALGEEIRSTLKEKGVDAVLPTVPYPTGTVEVTLDDKGVPQYQISEGVAWDNIPWNDEIKQIAEHTATVCFGTLAQRSEQSRKTIEAFIAATPEESVKVCDVNLRGEYYSKDVIEWSMKVSDVVKVNAEELVEVCRVLGVEYDDQHLVARKLIDDYKLEMLIVTCGTEGSYVYCNDENASCLPTPQVEVVDTVGAGDCFTGSLMAGLRRYNGDVQTAIKFATAAASLAVSKMGAQSFSPLKDVLKLAKLK